MPGCYSILAIHGRIPGPFSECGGEDDRGCSEKGAPGRECLHLARVWHCAWMHA